MLQERLDQLKQQREALQVQLEEISFLIQGYENTIKTQADQATNADGEAESTGDTEG